MRTTERSEKQRSEKQKDASRDNGAKSHGPVTPEGKKQSGRHHSRPAMLARTILLPGESAERFNELYLSFVDDLLPSSAIELALVEKMAVSHWRQMRAWVFERAALAARSLPDDAGTPEENPDDHAARNPAHNPERHALALVSPAQSAARIDYFESKCDRVFARCLDRILKLRAARRIANNCGPNLGSD